MILQSTDSPIAKRERRRSAMMSIGHVPDCTYQKWSDRAPDETGIDIVAAWHHGTPVHYPSASNGAVTRLHQASKMLLLARQGSLVSCYTLSNRPQNEQQYIRNQVTSQ